MKQDFDYTEFIERYLQGEMCSEERVWFEKEIEGNLSLKEEINIRKKVDLVLEDKDMIDLKLQLDQIHHEISEVTEQGRGAIRKIYQKVQFAAVALVVCGLAFSYYITNRNFTNDKLLELYYHPAQTSVNFRSADPNKGLLSEAMNYYNQKEYAKAIELFELILTKDKDKLGVNLYSGISYMEVNEFATANERFQRIIDEQPNPFVESANWYLGLCYVMADDRDKAIIMFEELAEFEGYYQKDAKQILKRLK